MLNRLSTAAAIYFSAPCVHVFSRMTISMYTYHAWAVRSKELYYRRPGALHEAANKKKNQGAEAKIVRIPSGSHASLCVYSVARLLLRRRTRYIHIHTHSIVLGGGRRTLTSSAASERLRRVGLKIDLYRSCNRRSTFQHRPCCRP